jgi:hypothetical protein
MPGVRQVLDLACRWFATNRLRLNGRWASGPCELDPRPTRRLCAIRDGPPGRPNLRS